MVENHKLKVQNQEMVECWEGMKVDSEPSEN
jgi:hypothetical protein